jgi:hypothetical protein
VPTHRAELIATKIKKRSATLEAADRFAFNEMSDMQSHATDVVHLTALLIFYA